MKDIAIYGAGGFGREIAGLLEWINSETPLWNFIGFYDDNLAKGTENEFGKVIGGISELNAVSSELAIAVAIGSPKALRTVVEKIQNSNVFFPNIIAPDFLVLHRKSFVIGKGNLICRQCYTTVNVRIGDFNIINGSVAIGHDSEIGNYNVIMPNVNISGNVRIGSNNFFGVKSTVLQGIEIGNNTNIGGQSLILRNTVDGNTYIGVPAKKLTI